jgi:transcriptional regulator with XRE-family HTH domain
VDQSKDSQDQAKPPTWEKRQTARIGSAVADFRTDLKITAQQLADRCAKLGMPSLSRAVITKLENGRREAVSTAELQVLAMALNVPAVLLLFPLGRVETVEVVPGRKVDPYGAIEWFIGNSEDPADPNAVPQLGQDSPLILWNGHLTSDGRLPVLSRELDELKAKARKAVTDEEAEQARKEVAEMERYMDIDVRSLRNIRRIMEYEGLTPPPLQPESARLLGEEGGGDGAR